jgi:iron-sulfur cluster repair protein YtfE (RIC family)
MSPEEAAAAPLDHLVERVQAEYRRLAQQALPALAAQIQTQAKGNAAEAVLGRIEEKLAAHIRREDELLYPVLLQMAAAPEPSASCCNTAPCRFCTVGHTLFMFEQEHEALNALAAELAPTVLALSGTTQRAAAAFAAELAELTRLENDELFSRAVRLERKLKGLPGIP